MNIRLQLIIIIAVLLALIFIIRMIQKKNVELRYALSWLIVGFGVLILAIFPKLIKWIAGLVGIYDPVNALFFLGFCFSLAIIFILTVAVSRASVRTKELTQKLALLEEELKESMKKN